MPPWGVFRGERAPKAKLTAAQVVEIRERYAAGGCGMADLAAEYGLHTSSVSALIRGRSWSHLPGSPMPNARRRQWTNAQQLIALSELRAREVARLVGRSELAVMAWRYRHRRAEAERSP